MAQSALILHRGARSVERRELDAIEAPPPTRTWFPIRHSQVLDTVMGTLEGAGFHSTRTQLALTPDNHRFFGTLDLESPVADGVTLAVGIRNSTDQSFPISFCCGERVFCCDNLAFSSEVVVSRKHTRFGELRFNEGISQAVVALHQYRETAAARIAEFRSCHLTEDQADAYLLRSYEKGLVTSRLLPEVIREWRNPSVDEFRAPTKWSLLNAFTGVLKPMQERNPARAAALTIRLQHLLN